jgi:hypothetical protein
VDNHLFHQLIQPFWEIPVLVLIYFLSKSGSVSAYIFSGVGLLAFQIFGQLLNIQNPWKEDMGPMLKRKFTPSLGIPYLGVRSKNWEPLVTANTRLLNF